MPKFGEFRPRQKMEPQPPLLIGLYSPRSGAGKTTAMLALGDILLAGRGTQTSFRPFSEPLKMAASAFLEHGLGLSDVAATLALHRHTDQPIPGFTFTGRQLLWWLETDLGRERIGEGVWVNRTLPFITADLNAGRNVIVDDVLHENEHHALAARGGLLVRLTRPQGRQEDPTGPLDHLAFHLHLQNVGSTTDLKATLRAWVKGLSSGAAEGSTPSNPFLLRSPASDTVAAMADEPAPPDANVPLTVSEVAFTITRVLADRPWAPRASKVLNTTLHRVAAEALAEALMREGLIISRSPTPGPGQPWPAGPQRNPEGPH